MLSGSGGILGTRISAKKKIGVKEEKSTVNNSNMNECLKYP